MKHEVDVKFAVSGALMQADPVAFQEHGWTDVVEAITNKQAASPAAV